MDRFGMDGRRGRTMMDRRTRGGPGALWRDRRGSVMLWVAGLAALAIPALALALLVPTWTQMQAKMQRAADTAAVAGAMNYANLQAAQSAATAAALTAQLNGATGTASPTWAAGSPTSTLTDNNITAAVTSVSGSNTTVAVTISQPIALPISLGSSATPQVTASATAAAVSTTSGGSGPQPCLVALSTTGSITGAGSTYVTMPNCSMRSNGTIGVHGGGSLTTGGIYAAGAISIDTWIPAANQHPNAGTIPDPYLTNTVLQTALNNTKTTSGTNITCSNQVCSTLTNGSYCNGMGTGSVTCFMKPGNYGAFNVVSGGPYTFNFAAGLYEFNGNMSFYGNTTSSGTNVTILTSGTFIGTNTFNFTLTAPSASAAASTGGIAGVALAGTTTGTVTLSGSDNFSVTGVVYFPNAMVDASGSSGLGISSGSCLEILGSSIKLSGASYFNSSCNSVNAVAFGSMPGTTKYVATLVK